MKTCKMNYVQPQLARIGFEADNRILAESDPPSSGGMVVAGPQPTPGPCLFDCTNNAKKYDLVELTDNDSWIND